MPIFRKLKESDTWHWCIHCKKWPEEDERKEVDEQDYEERYCEKEERSTLPGELDDQCLSLEEKGNCSTLEQT